MSGSSLCFLVCSALAADPGFSGQLSGPSSVEVAKYIPLIVLGTIIYFLFFYKKK